VKAYYDTRAPEYDDVWLGTGLFAGTERPGWDEEVEELVSLLRSLAPARTLDVACGTGFLTQHLPGEVTGLDQSASMTRIAGERLPDVRFVNGDALALPFPDRSFERLFTSFFYGHLDLEERQRFVEEARRVGDELVFVDAARRDAREPESMQERVLKDGSRWQVLKRYFEPEVLAAEVGDAEILHAGRWFVVVRA
jgi:ubiquinone/menaquinone biosynthesis C-methylase UbiE